jgi:hypothetical protein
VHPGGSWLPPAEDVLSCSSGTAHEKRLQENLDPEKLWTTKRICCSRQEDDPAIQKWHGAGDTIMSDTTRMMWYKTPRKDGRSGNVGRA